MPRDERSIARPGSIDNLLPILIYDLRADNITTG
jgi:hypothetical protein